MAKTTILASAGSFKSTLSQEPNGLLRTVAHRAQHINKLMSVFITNVLLVGWYVNTRSTPMSTFGLTGFSVIRSLPCFSKGFDCLAGGRENLGSRVFLTS